MQPDEVQRKKDEITSLVRNSLGLGEEECRIAERTVEKFCTITPPKYEHEYRIMKFHAKFDLGATSTKPGNVLLNWKKLIVDGSDSILDAAGAAANPILIPLAALVIWNKLRKIIDVNVSSRHAAVILAMWQHRNGKNRINPDRVLPLVNAGLVAVKQPPMTGEELHQIYHDLERIGCIELDDGDYWLREWIRVPYQ